MKRFILHADMDAFFASVAQRQHPGYRGRPLIVTGVGPRSVVSSASYEARRFGIHAGMPLAKAKQLCPHGLFVPVDGSACAEASRQALQIYLSYTPCVDPISIDEASLDLTGSVRRFGPPEKIAQEIQQRIAQELGLSVSIGLAPNRLLAKMAAEWRKPGGLTIVRPEDLPAILAPLPIEKLWGVGPATAARLRQMGLDTIGQLQQLPPALLRQEFGVYGDYLHRAAHGQDDTPVPVYDGRREWRQMSEELTLPYDTRDQTLWQRTLFTLCDELARRLRRAGYLARTITLKIRLHDFTTFTRSRTMSRLTDSELDLYREARQLLEQALGPMSRPVFLRPRVRLLGVAASQLMRTGAPWQPSLFEQEFRRRRRLCYVRDEILRRFGDQALVWASLLPSSQPLA